MKKIILLFAFTVAMADAIAQNNTTAAKNLKASADTMAKLFLNKRYDAFVKYTHPKIIALVGGKEKMVSQLKKSLEDMKAEGITISNVTIGEPSEIVVANNEQQAIVPQNLELTTNKGKLLSTSYLIAISKNNGVTWYFADTSGKTLTKMKTVFPSLSEKLIIPERQQPVLVN
jgi:hypothetical protein